MTRYPLAWPAGWKRMAPSARTRARFNKRVAHSWGMGKGEVTISEGTRRVIEQLRAFGVLEVCRAAISASRTTRAWRSTGSGRATGPTR
jgi:hypothetical protein